MDTTATLVTSLVIPPKVLLVYRVYGYCVTAHQLYSWGTWAWHMIPKSTKIVDREKEIELDDLTKKGPST